MATVYIALGSNMDSPHSQLDSALAVLSQHPRIALVATSNRYQTPPIGPQQPDFINAAAQLSTDLSPLDLLDALQAIEQQQHRVRSIHWGPRTLDLDILLYDNFVIESERLTIPHPRMAERGFVLVPLADLDAQLALPSGETVAQLLANCSQQGIVKTTSGEE
ncbi:2-amino-4-hydroxy-6-hydroxymethyldihydropteridine diphosphokinase [SAR92 clade bacterium H455]|uniref:2-amino-4-hydroxy-6-hydroxymethyldihydropteridine pyrophosphokinase n=1 Tax=SAR92 clade bacterium H455 TaxID=2974818 RepID=A0ABY5TM18_9GAMM|nr:2-amino-4-hydroxy-6-hydroxymethyldihydropteridine diphosphokinase [SAR92 clade bacterium H455]